MAEERPEVIILDEAQVLTPGDWLWWKSSPGGSTNRIPSSRTGTSDSFLPSRRFSGSSAFDQARFLG